MKIKTLLILVFSFFVGCANPPKSEKFDFDQTIKFLLQNGFNSLELGSYKYIVIISDYGCRGCNISLAQVMARKVNLQTALFIITASGSAIDISLFKPAKNVIYPHANSSPSSFDFSKVYFIDKEKLLETVNVGDMGKSKSLDDLDKIIKYLQTNVN